VLLGYGGLYRNGLICTTLERWLHPASCIRRVLASRTPQRRLLELLKMSRPQPRRLWLGAPGVHGQDRTPRDCLSALGAGFRLNQDSRWQEHAGGDSRECRKQVTGQWWLLLLSFSPVNHPWGDLQAPGRGGEADDASCGRMCVSHATSVLWG